VTTAVSLSGQHREIGESTVHQELLQSCRRISMRTAEAENLQQS